MLQSKTMCKQILFVTLLLTIVMGLIVAPVVIQAAETPDTSWYVGHENDEVYTIYTADQLAGLAILVNSGTDDFSGKTITLGADINLSNYDITYNDGKGWIPIGYCHDLEFFTFPFAGTFNGNNHTITGLYINYGVDLDDYIIDNGVYGISTGLFGYVWESTIQDLNVTGVNITGRNWVGGIVGRAIYSKVENCSVEGSIHGFTSAGGLIGYVYGSKIESCYSNSSISGNSDVGGIAGMIISNCAIEKCYSTGTIQATSLLYKLGGLVGGIAGTIFKSKVKNCYSTANVSGNGYVGGIVGWINYGGSVEICYSTGAVSINDPAAMFDDGTGGIVGAIDVDGNVVNCVALNPSVAGKFEVGRILGGLYYYYDENSLLVGNRAFAGLVDNNGVPTSWTNKTHDNFDGADMSATEIFSNGTLGGLFDGDLWTTANGFLPGLFGNPVDMPKHILSAIMPIGIVDVVPGEGIVTVTLNRSHNKKAALIVAVYNGNKLLNINTVTITNDFAVVPITISKTADTIKVMLWNDINNIQPLCSYREMKYIDNDWEYIE